MNVTNTVDGITYTTQHDIGGCDDCHAVNDPRVCAKLQATGGQRTYCFDHEVIWIQKTQPVEGPWDINPPTVTVPPAAVEGQSRFQLYGQVLNAWTAAGNSPTQLQTLSLQDFLEFCYTNRINLEITNAGNC